MQPETVRDENGIVIDHTNFGEYFFDVRVNRPQPGQIMAKYAAVALLVDGPEKRNLIKVLKKDKAHAAAMVMRKLHLAKEPDCYRVCREMCEDLLAGMTDDEVAKKEYEFVLEAFFYTKREYVPFNDPHWNTIDLVKFDPETNRFHSKIVLPAAPQKSDATPK